MTYFELVDKVRIALVAKADASKIEEHIAVQVNVTGEAAGAFYIEIKDGALHVEPFTYNDRDFQLTGEGADVLAVAQGKKTLESAVVEGIIAHEGNWDKTLVLSNIIPPAEKPAKKTSKKAKEEAPAEAPEEGQIALVEDAPKAEEAPKAEKEEKKTTKKASKTATKTAGKSSSAKKTKTTTDTKKTTKKTKGENPAK